jgi:hypothetical protein
LSPPDEPPRPRPRDVVPRERVPVLRERVPVLREPFAAPLELVPSLAFAVDARLAPERLDPVPDDFARVDVDLPAREAPPVERDDEARLPVEREVEDAERPRPPLPREAELDDEDDDDDLELLPLESSSAAHLPDMTRCAASATASAISEPSFVALDITLLAA